MIVGELGHARPHAGLQLQVLHEDLGFAAALVATATLYYLAGPTGVSLPLLALLGYLCWRRSDLAVLLIPLAMPLWMLPKQLYLVRRLDFSLGETAIVLCTLVVLVQQVISLPSSHNGPSVWRHLFPASRFERPALAFLGAALLATVAAHFHTVALRQFREVILEPWLFYWLILQRVRGLVGAVLLLLVVVGTGLLVAIMGVIQILFRSQDLALARYVGGEPLHLVRAVYGNENNLALLLDRAIPIALALALLAGWLAVLPGGWASQTRARTIARLWLVACSALMAVIVYRTSSRGGELALAVCLGVLFLYWQRKRPTVLAAGAAAVAFAAFLARNRLSATFTGGHGLTNDARLSVWDSALRMIRDHPLWGVGPDNFLYYYSNNDQCARGHVAGYYYVQAGKNFEPCLNHPHNLFLDLWLSTGLLGLLTALILLCSFVVLGLRAFGASDEAWRGPLLGALLAVLALVVHGQVDNSLFLPDLGVLFWLSVGVVALWWREPALPLRAGHARTASLEDSA